MSKKKAAAATKGSEGFESFYSEVYKDRWPELRESLLRPVRQVARINKFTSHKFDNSILVSGIPCLEIPEGERLQTKTDESGLSDLYFMDAASIFAATALDVQNGDQILDLCAAPGGKTLILGERIGETGRLVSNEMSDRRRARLRAVIEDYLPKSLSISVTGFDGTKWCLHETDAFDRILLDAPCSGERHLLADAAEMKLWSQARSKNLAVRQYALLASAHLVVRPGGRIVYSTCSISPYENDAVIARLLKKRAGEVQSVKVSAEIGEPTEHGWMILPDKTGYGPIYFAAIEKV